MSDSEIAAAREDARTCAALDGSGTSDHEIAEATSMIAAAKRAFVSRAIAVSDKGYIVGSVRTTVGGEMHTFLWTPENGMRVLSAPDDVDSEAVAVNDRGQVAGMHHHPGDWEKSLLRTGFLWQSESGMQDFQEFAVAIASRRR